MEHAAARSAPNWCSRCTLTPVKAGAQVLVADDSAVVRVTVSRRLRAAGLEVVEADGARAASAVDSAPLRCALLDLELGDGLGTEVAARLRAARPTLPLAFFSSATRPDVLANARSYGPVFDKPGELDAAVEWLVGHCRA